MQCGPNAVERQTNKTHQKIDEREHITMLTKIFLWQMNFIAFFILFCG